jgi:hypothetical protein
MEDRDLQSFIADLQLHCGGDHACSDMVLYALQQLRNGEITPDYCINLIMILLRPHQDLLAQFAEIIETPPLPQTRYGSIVGDPFLNTVVEFELWPGGLAHFLSKARRVLLHQCSMEDMFVDLEHLKPTSGPFWLLWELYKPILSNSWFMQAIYDGCISLETLPLHLEIPALPSQSDQDPVSVVQHYVVDSDLMCCYQTDCRSANRPIGILKHGSYGLLDRSSVDIHCSGRTVRDFAVLNDRWATSATGSESQFTISQKNQYEERLFSMEDERVQLDVRICRMRTTLDRLRALKETLETCEDPMNYFNQETFPNGVLTSTQILTLRELYDADLPRLFERLLGDPINMIEVVASRINERLATINELRRNKESDYYDLNKRNYSRSLEVMKHDQQASIPSPLSVPLPDEIQKCMVFKRESTATTLEMLNRIGRSCPQKDTAVLQIIEFISVIMQLTPSEPLQRQLHFRTYPSLAYRADTTRRWRVSQKIALAIYLFHVIWRTADALLRAQPPIHQFDGKIEGARGIFFAVALGHVSEASLRPDFAYEAVTEGIPAAFISGRHNPGLEALFEGLDELPLPNLDAFKRALHQFGKLCQTLIADDLTIWLIDAYKVPEEHNYQALVLEALSKGVFYSGITESDEDQIVLNLQIEAPRDLRTRRSMRILCPPDLGPTVFWNSLFRDQQQSMLTGRNGVLAKAAKRQVDRTGLGERSLEFRLGPHGVEFRGPGNNVMARQ